MPKLKDIYGQKFGSLTVLNRAYKEGCKRTYWYCVCDCGRRVMARGDNLVRGTQYSCGCGYIDKQTRRSTKHGHHNSKTYSTWESMKQRCFNEKNNQYHNYGGRGIAVCDRWLKFENFLEDMGEKPEGMSIDRIDNDSGYSKENCRWATASEQNLNKRSCVGDLTGKKFGRLTIKHQYYDTIKYKDYSQKFLYVIAECECGNIKNFKYYNLKIGKTRSCGCVTIDLRRETMSNKIGINL